MYLSTENRSEVIPVKKVSKVRLLSGVAVLSLPPAIVGVVAVAVLSQFISMQYGLKEFSTIVFVSIFLAIFVHEAAHVVAVGNKYSIESISFSLLLPHIVLNIPYEDKPGQRRDAIRILAAGSLGNLALVALFLLVFFFYDKAQALAKFSIIINFLSIAINLTPITFGGSGSDGLQILHLSKWRIGGETDAI